jgi:glucosamine-6-phosphate deaminase
VRIERYESTEALARAAAARGAAAVRAAIVARGSARVIAATGAAQFAFLEALRREPEVNWQAVTFFHLDEYVGLPETHPASFRRFLRERVVEPLRPKHFEFVNGSHPQPEEECARLEGLIQAAPIDVAFVGIGENGHLAFNDPPDADRNDPLAARVVRLAESSRVQQVNDGCFPSLALVPVAALTLTLPSILGAREIVCTVPGRRKRAAVERALTGPVNGHSPASYLREHPAARLYLDAAAAPDPLAGPESGAGA